MIPAGFTISVLSQLRTVRRQDQLQCSSRLLLHSFFPESRLDYCNSVLFGLPANLIQRLQSVQFRCAARLIFRIRQSGPITTLQCSSAFTGCASQNVSTSNCLSVMTHRSIHGTSTSYLQLCFTRVSDMTSRQRLRSSTSDRLDVPPVRLSTVGRRALPVSGAAVWNDLPLNVASAPSLAVFRQRLHDLSVFPFLPRHYHMTRVLLSPFSTTLWTPVVLAIINII